jgi:hypothetical protein
MLALVVGGLLFALTSGLAYLMSSPEEEVARHHQSLKGIYQRQQEEAASARSNTIPAPTSSPCPPTHALPRA